MRACAGTLDVQIPHLQREALDEVTSRLYLLAHQGGEHLVGCHGIFHLHPDQAAVGRIQRGLVQLFRVHLTQALVALDRLATTRLVEQPVEGLVEAAHGLRSLAATHHRAGPDQALTGGALDYISPMIYAYLQGYPEPAVESMGRRCLADRERLGVDRHKYVVTIAPAERTGEVVWPDKAMLYQVLEVAGSGAAGFKIWYEEVMNGGLYYWMSRALRMIQPVEDILLDGQFVKVPIATPNTRVHAFRHPTGTVLFVADYSPDKVELDLAEPVAAPAAATEANVAAPVTRATRDLNRSRERAV